ncbi:ATP-binding protein [Celeribacter indicus]|uniref:histidine kinase n=1 Tax=Celeribacter indicus TaxID=1208324 RepID=A0A0B5E5X3_9RHOB|nr:ATP-binding protein [Celeribacter indicus]AJE47727.1 Na+/solute symporter [Celeribacter indicus]SDW15377.1 Na+/proline symporter [Celeribacter indicus]
MIGFNLLVLSCLGYATLLFVVAFWAEKRAEAGRLGWLRSPLVYTLSLSIYCTAWTFYGAVGYAVRSGLEFATIYLGPTLVMIGWWWILRKLVRIGRTQRITSVADLISSRYGKSTTLGVLVTLLAVIGTTPYIALQLQSVALSFAVFGLNDPSGAVFPDLDKTALWVAAGLALFTALFGTRNLDANERHHGVVTAIALEAVVKFVALVAIGLFVIFDLTDGFGDLLARIDASPVSQRPIDGTRWVALTMLSGAALLTLPRMFQVIVVENSDESHLFTAGWAFPLYLLGMSLFVIPIAVIGLEVLPDGSNPDMFVLTLPLQFDHRELATLSFLGGFSSSTSMVIVAAIALSTMVSNHIVMPIWLSSRKGGPTVPGDVRRVVLTARRLSIFGMLALGYLYFHFSGGSEALASIGMISFTGVAQVLPAMIGGIFWRGATRLGAIFGVVLGFLVWTYTMFLPSFGAAAGFTGALLADGPFGLALLRPQALFGVDGVDPVVHAVSWSLAINTGAFLLGSLLSFPRPLERLQGAQFVNVFEHSGSTRGWSHGFAEAEDLLVMAQRILGPVEAQDLFQAEAEAQGKGGYLPDATPEFIERLERELAGSVGAATAHAMLGQIAGGVLVSVEDLMAVADETAQIMEYSNQLEQKSEELSRTARQLREANEKLTQLSIQKDAFLSQISHELRTPMTSIRAFSEILRDGAREGDLGAEDLARFSGIIHDEAQRLTRLLDDLLDLSVLESGSVSLNWTRTNLHDVIERAVHATREGRDGPPLAIRRHEISEHVGIETDPDRLAQVFINLIANARKYCDAPRPELRIVARRLGEDRVQIDLVDNGSGIPKDKQAVIFEKFSRLTDHAKAGGAGLGLAICREIMANLGGSISYLPGQGGAAFRLDLPRRRARAEGAGRRARA